MLLGATRSHEYRSCMNHQDSGIFLARVTNFHRDYFWFQQFYRRRNMYQAALHDYKIVWTHANNLSDPFCNILRVKPQILLFGEVFGTRISRLTWHPWLHTLLVTNILKLNSKHS
jgi:hypothetical protein